MKLSPHRLTHGSMILAFAVCLSLVTSTWPLAHAELYLQNTIPVAAPQCISGRTSYLHVRLEFLLYPQLIPQFCNTGGFEPRRTFTSASLWSWIAHMVSRVSWYQGYPPECIIMPSRTLTRSGCAFQNIPVVDPFVLWVLQPPPIKRSDGLGSSRFARHYSGNLN